MGAIRTAKRGTGTSFEDAVAAWLPYASHLAQRVREAAPGWFDAVLRSRRVGGPLQALSSGGSGGRTMPLVGDDTVAFGLAELTGQ